MWPCSRIFKNWVHINRSRLNLKHGTSVIKGNLVENLINNDLDIIISIDSSFFDIHHTISQINTMGCNRDEGIQGLVGCFSQWKSIINCVERSVQGASWFSCQILRWSAMARFLGVTFLFEGTIINISNDREFDYLVQHRENSVFDELGSEQIGIHIHKSTHSQDCLSANRLSNWVRGNG